VKFAAALAAKATGAPASEIFLASTGVIGEPLDASKFDGVLEKMSAHAAPDGLLEAAKAIMTTDTFPKVATASAMLGGVEITLSGMAKGAGMIAPDMATMLAFVFTDAPIASAVLQSMLAKSVQDSFNAITIDSDTSTSDTLLLFATGAAAKRGAPKIVTANDRRLAPFKQALNRLLLDLAHQVVKDGEGARKFVEVQVTGAASAGAAKKIALSIANSPLVKTAIAGEDANWGRIVMAVGKAGERAERDKLAIWFGGIRVAHKGQRDPAYDEGKVSALMREDEILIRVIWAWARARPRFGLAISPRNMSRSTATTGRKGEPGAPPARRRRRAHRPGLPCADRATPARQVACGALGVSRRQGRRGRAAGRGLDP